MKRFTRVAALSLLLGFLLPAAAQDDQYVKVFNLILQADALRDTGKGRESLEKYLEAQDALKKIQSAFPAWNDKVVTFRLKYLDDRIKPLQQQFPGTTMPRPILPPGTQDPLLAKLATKDREVYDLNQQIINLRAQKTLAEDAMKNAEAKLREALAARPADVDPREMDKAKIKAAAIQKDLDVQKITLEQQNLKLTSVTKERDDLQKKIEDEKRQVPVLKTENESLKKQVSDLNKQVSSLPKVQDLQNQLTTVKADLRAIQVQNEALLKDNKKMETLLTDPEIALGGKDAQKIKQLEKERDDLQKKLNDALKAAQDKKKIE
ncbi:MAG: hypothetical protein HY300_18875 [Verrucomicrobia bacterium]|nr:hypothetical protein [Verrucomicrobiota bacterium]